MDLAFNAWRRLLMVAKHLWCPPQDDYSTKHDKEPLCLTSNDTQQMKEYHVTTPYGFAHSLLSLTSSATISQSMKNYMVCHIPPKTSWWGESINDDRDTIIHELPCHFERQKVGATWVDINDNHLSTPYIDVPFSGWLLSITSVGSLSSSSLSRGLEISP